MNLKHNLMIAGIGVITLVIILLTFKWPLNIAFVRDNHPELKSEKLFTSPFNPTVNPDNQNKPIDTNVPNEPFPIPKLSKFPEEGIPVLMFHSISTIPGNSLGVPVKQFIEELEWLRQQNYHSLSLEEFYQAFVNKAQIPENPILLTFDDGYLDNYSAAWPILRQYGFRATFFIITNSVGPGMMNWDQLNDLARQRNSIGSHTVHHYDLAMISAKQQKDELSLSKKELENHIGISVQAFCFPSGRYNKTTLELMPTLGYRLGFTTKPGKVHLGDDLLTLKRLRISGGMSLTTFQKLIRFAQ
jgi:peptidoglycan/xylan/chitin deacetylase (PgdA/CDA1 family)